MAEYKVNEEGVAHLRKMASKLEASIDEVTQTIRNANSIIEDYGDTLGPQGMTTLKSAIDGIAATISGSFDSINEVVVKLSEIADDYEEEINNDPFAGIGQRVKSR